MLVTIILVASKQLRLPITVRGVLLLPAGCLVFMPINGLPVAGYIRGLLGDLSITTLILLFTASMFALLDRNFYTPRSFFLFMLLVLTVGLFLYPFSLGFTDFDPYALGYSSKTFLAFFFALALTAWYFNLYFVVVIIVLDVSAYLMGIYESSNIWDYLIDPVLTLFAFFWLIIWMIKRVVQYQSLRRQTHNVVEKAPPPKDRWVPIQEKP
ncbi:MAG: hypothetical protein JRJ20_10105 [Deltaproteobacteria bacterium]|nr:hypothetical protein [Deltaproteobacteria bacterium]